jgi:7-cyano-7-deazaguanine synthase in queuosine biosynthesis
MTATYAIRRKKKTGGYEEPTAPIDASVFAERTNLFTGLAEFVDIHGPPTPLECDLLAIAAGIFAADRASKRGEREDLSRRIDLHVPVHCLSELLPQVPLLQRILRDLSQDHWNLVFSQMKSDSDIQTITEESIDKTVGMGSTLLFSGGLDSLAAAVEFGGDDLLLVSHVTRNTVTDRAQTGLVKLLEQAGLSSNHNQYFVSSSNAPPYKIEHAVEASQRTRSFVFLTLGALAARRNGHRELLMMAENGQMAIHLPLTSGRIGAFSTHTANPTVLAEMESFLSTVLQFGLKIRNPYVYKTKAEVVSVILKNLPNSIELSTSCWKNTRITEHGATHCGECIPCYIRRIAVEVDRVDPTVYARDVWALNISGLPPDDDGRRNLLDLLEFVRRFLTGHSDDLMCEFPELYSSEFDGAKALDMYKRFASEATAVFKNYPEVAKLLK